MSDLIKTIVNHQNVNRHSCMYVTRNQEGQVYIVKNEAMPGLYKIGCGFNALNRIKKLSANSAVPWAFQPILLIQTDAMLELELTIHMVLRERNYNKEFFKFDSDEEALETVIEISNRFSNRSQEDDYWSDLQ